jgi:two-component system, chemotaxis family, protein-glutamate methylesterase/glutaminase
MTAMVQRRTLNVLVAEDSAVSRQLLVHIINSAPDMRVVGEAITGRQAVKMAGELRPDVILMDMIMPELNGLEAIQEIMYLHPVPIVAVSAQIEASETDLALQAIKAGALTAIPKPPGPRCPTYQRDLETLVSTLRTMAGVHVIHHRLPTAGGQRPSGGAGATGGWPNLTLPKIQPEIVAIVASTGGPAALSDVIQGLPEDFPLPIVIVQHIASDFVPSLVQHLSVGSRLPVSIAQADEAPLAGHVYLAPGSMHLRLTPGHRFSLDRTQGQVLFMPSGNNLLESVAKSYREKAIGLVLTGMGNDGTAGLAQMRQAGAFTIAQDEASSVVFGMPKSALAANAVCQVVPLAQIAPALVTLATRGEQTP